MAKDTFTLPQSSGGLVRYFESTKEAITIKPQHILLVSLVIIAAELGAKIVF